MTGVLFRKELRELRPWAILSLFIGSMEVVEHLFDQVDLLPASLTIDTLGESSGVALFVIAFSIGTGLLVREAEDGTLAFLDGLPVSRTQVFFVKHIATCVVLFAAPAVSLVTVIALHLLSRGSLDADLHLDLLLGYFVLQLAAIVHGLILGAALGWLRSLTWLVAGTIATGLMVLVDKQPRAACLNPLSILDATVTAGSLTLDREAVLVQVAFAGAAGALAWWQFMRAGRPKSALNLSARPVIGAIASVTTVIAVGTAFVVAMTRHDQEKGTRAAHRKGVAEKPRFAPSAPAQTTTKHVRFSYPATHAEAAIGLARQADSIFERVHSLLETPLGPSLDIDGSGSLENTEGTAYLGRVRISLVAPALPAVLAHEMTHVIAQRLAGDDRAFLWRKATVLNEGLATWVERHFREPESRLDARDADASDAGAAWTRQRDTREAGRLALAALYTRRELLVAELVDPDQLAMVRDDNLKYPAGEALIDAIVRVHGVPALTRLLAAFGNSSLPQELKGQELWQATFQLAGMDLGRVIDEMFRQVARDAEARAKDIAALPRIRIRLVRDDDDSDYVGVQALTDSPAARPQAVRIRFKPAEDSPFEDYRSVIVSNEEPHWRSLDDIRHGRICAQPGVFIPPDQVLYEPWVCLATKDAEPWDGPLQ